MKKAGFNYVAVAIESGNQEIINKLRKGIDLTKVNRTVQALRKNGIITSLYFMLGLPFDTESTLKETIEFAKTIKAEHVFFWITLPFPGTPLYEMAKEKGRFLYDPYQGFPGYEEGKAVVDFPHLPAKLIEYYYKKAFREFYIRPSQIIRTLRSLKRTPVMGKYIIRSAIKLVIQGKRI